MAERTGLGTLFMRETAAESDVFTEIAQVVTITPPSPTRDTVDVDELSPANDFRRKLVGLIDGGDMTVVLNFDPENASQGDLQDDFAAAEPWNYRIQFPYDDTVYEGGGYYEITAIVTAFAPQEIAAGEVMQAEVTFAVVAKPTYVDLEEAE